MSDVGEAAQAIAALFIGGLIFSIFGAQLGGTLSPNPLLNLQLWGAIYILVAIVLAVGAVYAFVRSAL